MQIGGVYGRISTDEQNPTSVEDQVRVCTEKAIALGCDPSKILAFSDLAVTGAAKGLSKRSGYQKLLAAWEKGQFDVLVATDVSRLTRDNLELARIQERVERTGIHLVTTDGLVDSSLPGWQLQFGISGVFATHCLRETRERVKRAMLGLLLRGFMIAAPAFGYRLQRDDADTGTRWLIDEDKSRWVREIFRLRQIGTSLGGIARHMNEAGQVSPRASRNGGIRYWRPATVRQMLQNPIYKGIFVYNGSPFTRARAKRERIVVTEQVFLRPELQIIDDDTWAACNAIYQGKAFRGGARHVFSGLCECGECGATLTIGTGGSAPTLYCAQCGQAARAGVPDRKTHYASARGLQAILLQVLQEIFSDDAVAAYRQELRQRLENGVGGRIEELTGRIHRLQRSAARYLDLIDQVDDDAPVRAKYLTIETERRQCIGELDSLEAGQRQLDTASIERQLEVHPSSYFQGLFSGHLPVDEVRAALRQTFPRIVLLGKPERFTTDFQVDLVQGVGYALCAATPVLQHEGQTLRYRVSTGSRRPAQWAVTRLA